MEKGGIVYMKNSILKTIKKMVNYRFIIEKAGRWVERRDLEKPLMVVFITEESWKNPGSL